MRNAARPVVQIVDVVAHISAVSAKQRPFPFFAHLLKLARAKAQVKCSLVGREEWCAFACARSARVFVVHQPSPLAQVEVSASQAPADDEWIRFVLGRLEFACIVFRAP